MIRLVALFALICVCLLLFGGAREDRLTIRTLPEETALTISITLHDVNESYRWLSVYGCAAEHTEAGVYCTGHFERESTQELFGGKKQHLFTWRHLPSGMMQITSVAFDVDRRPLARGQAVVFR